MVLRVCGTGSKLGLDVSGEGISTGLGYWDRNWYQVRVRNPRLPGVGTSVPVPHPLPRLVPVSDTASVCQEPVI